MITNNHLFSFWGKTDRSHPDSYHPALFHMLDAGQVAWVLLTKGSGRWRASLAKALASTEELTASLLPWLVALHDIGKVSQAFQEMSCEQKSRLCAQGVSFGRRGMSAPHTVVAAGAWSELMATDIGGLPDGWRQVLRQTVAGHHGRWLQAGAARRVSRALRSVEPHNWRIARSAAVQWLTLAFHPSMPNHDITDLSSAIMALSGFTILCDWLASDQRHFHMEPDTAPDAYVALSRERALQAAESAGFLQPSHSSSPTSFGSLYTNIRVPRPLQRAIDDLPERILREPTLAIIEAPTGEGKTEAALALAHRIGALRGWDGLYYALPTMATSNSMFERVSEHLSKNLALSAESRLVHSQAFLVQDDATPQLMVGAEDDNACARSWFAPLKRALLAPFGVGTIDQAELAVLNVRHVALRCIGLAGKVIILDEVHAYDVYVSSIIARLLTWLRSLGTSVIVLSATLPAERRRLLLEAWSAQGEVCRDLQPYPRLEITSSAGNHVASPATFQTGRHVGLGWLSFDEQDAEGRARWLLEELGDAGCACWITNTVAQAQDLYAALRHLAPAGLSLALIHSRYGAAQRHAIEQHIVDCYGPTSPDARHGIVVGTQVLEQSLDLDFDLMISELAPVDLLLQRAGRLFRHQRPGRPISHAKLWVNVAHDRDGEPSLGVNASIYGEYILRRTLDVLNGRDGINLPEDYRALIEPVYAPDEPADPGLAQAWRKLQDESYVAAHEAEQRLLPEPSPNEPFCTEAASLIFQEIEGSASWGAAQTRLGAESVTLVPLERDGSQAWLVGTDLVLPVDREPTREQVLTILRHAVRVSHKSLVATLKDEGVERPKLFGHPLLRYLYPLWLRKGVAQLGRVTLRLDKELGLVIAYCKEGDFE